VVLALLEKQPRHRPTSALALDAELSAVELGRPRHRRAALRRWRRVRSNRAAMGMVALGSAGLLAYGGLRPDVARIEPNLLAVAPFEVADSSLRLWREGLVDVLSLDLDGAGPLRTVPQTVVLRKWSGRADRVSAAALGKRTGAELVVFGHVVRRGADSVALRVAVLDRSRHLIESDVEVAGDESRMGDLADSLGVEILRTLGRTRAIGGHRHRSIGSRSLGALKEFLAGEQFYRQGRWDSAFARYERAVAQDSTFALALRRLTWVAAWRPAGSAPIPAARTYLRRAVTLNRGLSPRDSALLTADSLFLTSNDARTADELVANHYARVRVLEELARRYPDDPEVWYVLGERRVHGSPPIGGMPRPALEAFDRAIALDPGFAPAYDHVFELAIELGQPERAAEYARAYTALRATGLEAASVRLTAMIFDSGVAAPAVSREVRSASANTLTSVGNEHLRWWTDSAETAIALLRELVTGRHAVSDAPPPAADSLMWRQHLASALAFRGRLHAARTVNEALLADASASPFGSLGDPFDDLALMGLLPDSLARRTYAEALEPGSDWDAPFLYTPPRHLRGLPWWLARGDTGAIAAFARRAEAVAREAESPGAVLRGRYFGAAATAYLALGRGDSAGAVRSLEGIPDTLCLVGACYTEKLTLARLLVARGEDRRAAEILNQWSTAGGASPSAVLAALEHGRIAERLGDRRTALERYGFVAAAWREPDPELRPYLVEAREAVRRLTSD
jgi:serine/threonine-protein kinase